MVYSTVRWWIAAADKGRKGVVALYFRPVFCWFGASRSTQGIEVHEIGTIWSVHRRGWRGILAVGGGRSAGKPIGRDTEIEKRKNMRKYIASRCFLGFNLSRAVLDKQAAAFVLVAIGIAP